MTRARKYGAVGALLLVGLVVGTSLLRRDGTGRDLELPAAADDDVAAETSSSSLRATVPDGPFDSMRARLETAAAAGDADAAFRMGRALAHCLNYRPLSADQMTALMAELVAKADGSIRIDGRALSDERSIDMVLFAAQEANRLCADTDSLRAAPPALAAYHYIAQAAEAGHPQAMAMYPDLAFREFRLPIELIENAEEVDRRRKRARAYLLGAVRAGQPEALLAASRAYAADGWLARDPERSLAYWIAYTATDDFGRIPESLASDRTAELEGMLTASQRDRATTRAARLMDVPREQTDAY